MKKLLPIVLAAFFITACDQKPDPKREDCSKPVAKMTDAEKEQCGKAGSFTKSPHKEW
ncbi:MULTISPECIES: entry exclusion lipoprotein TrbK [Enterobacteriaceae]|jgi:entry exclusion lipoprotein TrbK|uniref:entry exclusion lipoprotein TrbK n=1 Tax=Enterobacteriaceae TaxID=543 RepID=UPI0005307836|nr:MULTISPECIES: entry exclusion lipoprotein TrbK [Enterobacteriaceae]EAT2030342.1 entry exclusion lipoprotein TrbK [Salmonella enterica]EDK5405655.1 entry exclusion lipoprotein TrbK [Salmonella enterica subsp. enterica serovar Newport]EAT5352646.1 entry exclusion lipoprotein TrbK [Salmonella enterica]EAX5070730.1 entry exclusion lipoprotein TrbK [Salmonella enterica]EBP8466960.1 entry exclusion lipoprotein TrbK [Salmonella enterica]